MNRPFSFPKRKLRKLISSGEYSEALEFAATIEPKYANDPDFLFIMASAHYILGNADESLKYYERVLAISKFDIDALLLSARVYAHTGDKDEAARRCKKILENEPDHREALELLDSLNP